MSILDDLNQPKRMGQAGYCKTCEVLASLGKEEREAVESTRLGARSLAAILTQNGHPIGATAILKHRQEGHSA